MKLPVLLSLLAFIAAPLSCIAQETNGADRGSAPADSSGDRAGAKQLILAADEKTRTDMVHFVGYQGGANRPEPRFTLWTPTELREEYDAIPTEPGRFEWIADHFRQQLEKGDVLSGNDLGILHLYGLGVEKDWKKAQAYFVEPIKHGRWVGQRYLAELLVMSREQPDNARLAGQLIIPLLKASYLRGRWAAFQASSILAKDGNPEDKALADSLIQLSVEMFQAKLKSPPDGPAPRKSLFQSVNALTQALLDDPTATNCQFADSIVAAWLAVEPNSVEAKVRSLGVRICQKDAQKEWTESNALLAINELDENTRKWAQGIRVHSGLKLSKLGAELSWDDFFQYGVPEKYQNMLRSASGVLKGLALGLSLLLLGGLSVLTRFRKKDEVGILLLLCWCPVFLIAEVIILGPSWAIALYCPIALYFLWSAVSGPKALPYFVAPRRGDYSAGKTWLQIAALCALLFVSYLALANGYQWLYQRVTGARLAEQAIRPFLNAAPLSRRLAIVLAVGIFIPALEETMFRGFLHDWLSRKLPIAFSMVLSSLLFGFIHGIDYGLPLSFLGFACLWLRLRYQSLFPAILLHALNNTVFLLVLFVQS
jgi:membrane protease YdiL (CAAX protease family)